MDLQIGFACCLALILGLALGIVAMVTLRSARTGEGARRERLVMLGTNLRRFAFTLLALSLLGLGVVCAPHVAPKLWIPTLERTSAPIVDAVERCTRDHGRPPERAGELIPQDLSDWPDTGYPGQDKFDYECYEASSGVHTWALRVWTGLGIEDDSALVWSSRTRQWTWSPD